MALNILAEHSPKNANSGPHHIRLPAVKVTQVNPTVDNTKLLFFAKALRSIIGELGLKWAPSARPRSGSIMKNTISKSANKPINGVTRKPHLQSEAFAATSEPEKIVCTFVLRIMIFCSFFGRIEYTVICFRD